MKKYVINPQTGNIVDANGKIGKAIIKQKENRNQSIQYYSDRQGNYIFQQDLRKRMIPIHELEYLKKTKKEIIDSIHHGFVNDTRFWRKYINEKVLENKCCIVERRADGDCLFHSLASYIPKKNGIEIRKDIVNYEKQHKQFQITNVILSDPAEFPEFEEYLEENEIDFDDMTRRQKFQLYLARMGERGVYGQNLEIQSFCELFQMNVVILQDNNTITIHSPQSSPTNDSIFLYYTGIHYDVLYLEPDKNCQHSDLTRRCKEVYNKSNSGQCLKNPTTTRCVLRSGKIGKRFV